jgi:hypothetical protein
MGIKCYLVILLLFVFLTSCGYVVETDFVGLGEADQVLVKSWSFDSGSEYTRDPEIDVTGGLAVLLSDFFDNSWLYRLPAVIDNTGNPLSLTQYEVRIVLNSSQTDFWGGVEGDGRSLRFTDDDKNSLLDHFTDSFDFGGESAELYVNVPSVPGSSVKTVYLYFGNPSALSSSSGENTFFFFDDFESGDLGWQQYASGSVMVIDDGGNMVLRKYFQSDPNGGYRTFSSAIGSFEATFRTNRVNFNGGGANRYALENSGFSGYGALLNNFDAASTMYIEERSAGTGSTISATRNPSLSSLLWYRIRMRRYGSTVEFELFNDSGSLLDSVSANDSTVASFDRFTVHGGYEFYTDDIRIRNYTSPDPGVSFGQIETLWPSNKPSIVPNSGQSYTQLFSFSESLGPGSDGTLGYQISNDGIIWYWWDGSGWIIVSGAGDTNSADEVDANIAQFVTDVGSGTFYFKAFFISDGTKEVQLDSVDVGYI